MLRYSVVPLHIPQSAGVSLEAKEAEHTEKLKACWVKKGLAGLICLFMQRRVVPPTKVTTFLVPW